jgi:hypothetical protein
MEVFRTQRPEVLKYIIPHLITGSDLERDNLINSLLTKMVTTPDDICVAIAIDGADLIGYTIGWVVNNNIWLGQSWLDVNYDREDVGFKAIDVVKEWAVETHDIHDMRFETKRSARALSKAWGFKELSVIMQMEF